MATSLIGSDGLAGVYWRGSNGNIYTKNNLGITEDKGFGQGAGVLAPGANYSYGGLSFREIANPNGGQASTEQPTSTGTTYSSTPNYAAISADTIAKLGQSESTINNALGRLGNQLNIAKSNIGSQYGQRSGELDTSFNQNQNSYNSSTTQNKQNLRSNKNVINDQASSGLRGLQRLLGSYGAVGSDMGLAGQAVAEQASAQNAGAGQAYAQNQRSLDTNWGNFNNQLESERKKLNEWRGQQEQQVEQQSATSRQDLLTKLSDIRGQMAAARGGSYAAGAQPYLDQANSLSGRIDELGRFNPTYSGVTPVYEAPTLGSYDTRNGATIGAQAQGRGGLNTPYLNILLGREKDKQLV